jgi:hypothetical protein
LDDTSLTEINALKDRIKQLESREHAWASEKASMQSQLDALEVELACLKAAAEAPQHIDSKAYRADLSLQMQIDETVSPSISPFHRSAYASIDILT